jgi:ubiquinone/menaquinone biosynthesis C-methylase UbiE
VVQKAIPGERPLPVRAAYDLSAPFYDDWEWQKFWRAYEFPLIRDMFGRMRKGRGRPLHLLDVGCGTGWYLEHLAAFCNECIGIDVSEGMLAIAHHRLRFGTGRAMLKIANAERLPFHESRSDVVMCTRVLSHLPNILPAVREMRRTLMPGEC